MTMTGLGMKLSGMDDIGSGEVTSRPSMMSRIQSGLAYVGVICVGLILGFGVALIAGLFIFGIKC